MRYALYKSTFDIDVVECAQRYDKGSADGGGLLAIVKLLSHVWWVEPYSVAIEMSNGHGLVGYQDTSVLNNVHGL